MKSYKLAGLVGMAGLFLAASAVMAGDRAAAAAARRTAAKDKGEAHKAALKDKGETRKADVKEKAEARKAEVKEKAEERKAALADKKEKAEAKATERVDTRQSNQEKRITHGINKGYLTPAEVSTLQAQQQSIASLESSALSDGKLTRDEFSSIRTELNKASANIWSEKHDTEGNQMAAYRFGKNVFAKDSLTSGIESGSMTPDQAKTVMKDFRQMSALKCKLSGDDLSDANRASLQAEYDALLNMYFEVR